LKVVPEFFCQRMYAMVDASLGNHRQAVPVLRPSLRQVSGSLGNRVLELVVMSGKAGAYRKTKTSIGSKTA
jgi:hypothetical protein